jgi:MoaA/NifB/PqqE/SkfB family radical SAM enzyme
MNMGHKYIKWDFTGRCNLRCAHCSVGKLYFDNNSQPLEELTATQRLEIVDKLAAGGVEAVSFLGGEPLLVKDGFFDVASRCAEKGIATTVVTNGLLINEETIAEFVKARIGTVVVSIDGASPDTHDFIRGRGTFQRVLANLEKLTASIRRENHPIRVRINTVINRRNVGEIASMLNLWMEKGIDEWGVLALGGVGFARDNLDSLYLSPEQEINAAVEFAKCWNTRPPSARLEIFPQFIYPVIADYIEANWGLEIPRPMLCCNAAISLGFIRPDGTMYACDRVPNDRYIGREIDGAPIKPMSLIDHDFFEIWNSDYFRAMFPFALREKTYHDYDPCNRCKYLQTRTCNPCPLYSLDSKVVVRTCKLIEERTGGFQKLTQSAQQAGLLDSLEPIRLETPADDRQALGDPARIPRQRPGVRSYIEDDQLILLNPYDVTFCSLNLVGRMLWESMDGRRCLADFVSDVTEVASGVAEKIEAPEPAFDFSTYLSPQVHGFFQALEQKGLIEWV